MLKKLVLLVTASSIKTRIWLLILAVLIAPGILGSNIVLDGTLSTDEWDGSLSFDLEYELMPSRNTPAALKTTAYVQYDKKYWNFLILNVSKIFVYRFFVQRLLTFICKTTSLSFICSIIVKGCQSIFDIFDVFKYI